jgi:AraC-like DNA-binding protein
MPNEKRLNMSTAWQCDAIRLRECNLALHIGRPGGDSGTHNLDRPLIGIILAGDCRTTVGNSRYEARRGDAWIEPTGERRRNLAGRDGVISLSVLPETDGRTGLFGEFPKLLSRFALIRDHSLTGWAHLAAAELRRRDSLSQVALLGHALSMVASITRAATAGESDHREPSWMRNARDYIHAHFREPVCLDEIARTVGVSPEHLSRTFTRFVGTPVADYARQLRVQWAADELLRGNQSVAEVATRAGYFDQSHFTREFRRRIGSTPAEYRRLVLTKHSSR